MWFCNSVAGFVLIVLVCCIIVNGCALVLLLVIDLRGCLLYLCLRQCFSLWCCSDLSDCGCLFIVDCFCLFYSSCLDTSLIIVIVLFIGICLYGSSLFVFCSLVLFGIGYICCTFGCLFWCCCLLFWFDRFGMCLFVLLFACLIGLIVYCWFVLGQIIATMMSNWLF